MLISKKQAAGILGVSTRTFDRYRAAGCFKGIKFRGHTVRFNKSDIEAAAQRGLKD